MASKFLNIPAGKIVMQDWKKIETIEDINNDKKSYSKSLPALVSYMPDEKKYIILDGHHRIIEMFMEGIKIFCCEISEYVPKTYQVNYPIVLLKNLTTNN